MHHLIKLAKQAVETYIKERKIISPPEDFPKEFLTRRAGTFVTIENRGQLRGCIGTYLPTRESIAEEVIYNAIAAASEDYRFAPLTTEELADLSYTVYILNKPEPVRNVFELDPKEYGIIVKSSPITENNEQNNKIREKVTFDGQISYKTGLLLPDLEGVDTVEKQISIACEKARIDLKKEKISIYKFTVQKYQ
jgi:AmmeMemoRadiSam system protein A